MTQTPTPTSHPQSRPQGAPQGQPTGGPQIQRQFVNFAFFKLDPEFRRLTNSEKQDARDEFLSLFAQPRPGMMCLSYSTAGLRPDCDFLLWRISLAADDFQTQTAAINKTCLGGYLTTPWSFVSMTKRSMYIDKVDSLYSQ